MSGLLKFELNREGVRELLRSPEVEEALVAEATVRADSLGAGYTVDPLVGKNRVNVRIVADSPEAAAENLKENTLLQAIS